MSLAIIRGSRFGSLNIKGIGVGFPAIHDQSRTAGNGIITTSRAIYYRQAIENNTAPDSVNQFDWLTEAASNVLWRTPIAISARLGLIRTEQNSAAMYVLALGDVPSYNSLLSFTQWRTGNPGTKRIMVLMERGATGIVTWFLAWADGTNVNSITMPALANDDWISLVYSPSPKRADVFKNGNFHVGSASIDLPAGNGTGSILASIGIAHEPVGSVGVRTQYSLFGPAILPVQSL